jgi:hypothetical protein
VEAAPKTFSVLDAPRGQVQSNWYEEAPVGHESSGRVLMRAVDYKVMVDAQTEAGLVLTFGTVSVDADQEDPAERVEVAVIATGATPAVTSSNVDVDYAADKSDTVEVTLVGLNYWLDRRSTSLYNYNAQDGFELNASNLPTDRTGPAFQNHVSSPMALLTALGYAGSNTPSFVAPPVAIRNVYSVGRPVSELVGRVVDGLGLVASYPDRKVYNKGELSTANQTRLTSVPMLTRVLERTVSKMTDERFPAQVDDAITDVGPASNPGDLYLVRRTPSRGSLTLVPEIQVGHWFAYRTGVSPANAAELASIADWFITGKGNVLDIHSDYGTFRFAGIFLLTVDGAVRRVLWSFNANDVSTTIRYNHAQSFRVPESDRKVVFTGVNAIGSRSIDGTDLMIPSASGGGSSFLARVVSAVVVGNKWRYVLQEVTVVDGGTSITSVATSRPPVTAYNGHENPTDSFATGYGLGFYPSNQNITLTRQPIKVGAVVPVSTDANGLYVFGAPNGYRVICQ